MRRYVVSGSLALLVLATTLLPSTVAVADEQTVLQVVVVDVTGGVDNYVQEVIKARSMMKRLGIKAEIRVWQAVLAGESTGAVVVTVEFATIAAYADSYAKTGADSEYQRWLEELGEIRTITSNSLYRELMP